MAVRMETQSHCSFCGRETWACSHGGHCYSEKERKQWELNFGKSTNYKGFPKLIMKQKRIFERCPKCKKKGVEERMFVVFSGMYGNGGRFRECRYCKWSEDLK